MEQKTIYYISEAAKKVQVESHVLRYWEDELKLPIKRNEMGHRYYTEQDIEQLRQIKVLKEQGLQLKAIRTVLFKVPPMSIGEVKGGTQTGNSESKGNSPDGKPREQDMEMRKERLMNMVKERVEENVEKKMDEMATDKAHKYIVALSGGAEGKVESKQEYADAEKTQKAARLQYLLQHMITDAVKSANRELCNEVKDSILKELDYQFRLQEERDNERRKQDEEHYRKIDEMIRERRKPKEKLLKKFPVK